MAWVIYHNFSLKQENGNAIDLDTDDLRCMLVTSSYTPVQATHDFIADVGATEVSGTNYTAGGYDMTGLSVALSTGTVTFDAGDPTWSQHASGFSDARYAVLYKNTSSASTGALIAYADLGGNKGNVDGDLTLELDANGIFQKTVS